MAVVWGWCKLTIEYFSVGISGQLFAFIVGTLKRVQWAKEMPEWGHVGRAVQG